MLQNLISKKKRFFAPDIVVEMLTGVAILINNLSYFSSYMQNFQVEPFSMHHISTSLVKVQFLTVAFLHMPLNTKKSLFSTFIASQSCLRSIPTILRIICDLTIAVGHSFRHLCKHLFSSDTHFSWFLTTVLGKILE